MSVNKIGQFIGILAMTPVAAIGPKSLESGRREPAAALSPLIAEGWVGNCGMARQPL